MSFPFDYFCATVVKIKALKIEAKKKEKFGELIKNWRESVDNNLFPLMRLLIPHLDRERGTYGLKEQKFADLYIKIMGMDKSSDDAKSLIQFKKPKEGKIWVNEHIDQGHFISRLNELLRLRMLSHAPSKTLTIAQVNEKLDELASSSNTDEKEAIIRFFYTQCTRIEQIWIARIILKNMDFGMTERSLLPLCHPDAFDYYNVNTNLKAVFEELQDPSKRRNDNQLRLFCPFRPMLSEKYQPSAVATFYPSGFWIETKIDGERIQMHFENGEYRWWSRNSIDYTHMYGANKDRGSLVPFIHKCFKVGVTSCILDGEMVAYNTDTKAYEPFGTLKTAANDVNNANDNNQSSSSTCHPCFVVFDLLLLNGKSLLDRPLRKRFEYLEKMIVSNNMSSTRIQVHQHQLGKTEQDVFDALEIRIANNEEGLVVKNPDSIYTPSGKVKDWIKIKPDTIQGLIEDMDLVMVGAYYGKGSRGGSFGSFLCAILDDSDAPVRSYISFCKFGTGVKRENYLEVSLEKSGHWKPFDPQNKPDWLVLPVKSDWPDMIIEPSKSHVVQVRANEIIPSKTFPAGLTARFPRFIRLRTNEKDIEDALTKSGLHEYNLREKGKREMEAEGVQKTEKRQKTSHARSLVAGFVGLNEENVAKKSTIFDGIEFCVMLKTAIDSGELKRETERMILELGGSLTQVPSLDATEMIIADEFTIRVRNQQGLLNIVKSKYISDCARLGKMLPLSPKYMLSATLATESTFTALVDKYNDSFCDDLDVAELKALFAKMPIPSLLAFPVWNSGPALDQHVELKQSIASIGSRYLNEPFVGHLFIGSVFYIPGSELDDILVEDELYDQLQIPLPRCSRESQARKADSLDLHRCLLISDIRLGGGIIVEALNRKTSYIVCNSANIRLVSHLLSKYPSGSPISRIVSEEWIRACMHAQTMVSEF